MINVLCVCGNGMGTSTILKISVRKICVSNNIDASIESCSAGEALSYLNQTDIVLTSPEWANMLPSNNAHVIQIKNLVDNAAVEKALVSAVKEHFPEAIQ